jgi:long-chain acyl-CoA synthetase
MEKKKLRNVAQLYREAAISYASEKSFLTRKGSGEFDGPTYKELYDSGLDLSAALIERCKLQPKEHVAILADNRIEWMIADYAIILAGAADVPRGTDATEHDIEYIVNHAGCRVVFIENQSTWEKFLALLDKLPGVEHVVFMSDVRFAPTRLTCYNIARPHRCRQCRSKNSRSSVGLRRFSPTISLP